MKLKRKSKHAKAPGVTSGNDTAMFNRNLLNKIGINIYFTFQRLTSHVYYKKKTFVIFLTCPQMTASYKELRFRVMKKLRKVYKWTD